MIAIRKTTRCEKRKGSTYYLMWQSVDVVDMVKMVSHLMLILERQECGKELHLPPGGGVIITLDVSKHDRITITYEEVEDNE